VDESSAPDAAPRLLVVDNDVERRERTGARLAADGFRVEMSEGSGSALWLAQTFRPWVIVTPHDLPVTDGLEVVRLLKGDGETSHIPLILTLAAPNEALMIRSLEAGANLVLPEPVAEEVLSAHVYAQLNVFQMVMELREKNQYLRELVVRDPMTGLFNHGHMHEILDREVARSQRTLAPVSLLIIDLDNFKTVNDDHGHQAGDYCLKTCASLLSQGGRRSDSVARYGGDEFAIVLPETPKAGAAARSEALRKRVESRAFSDIGLPSQTISVGVATYPDDGSDRQELIGAADRALYAAKRVGRNRVVAYSPDLDSAGDASGPAGEIVERLLALTTLIDNKQAGFVYQPIVSVDDGSIFAYEALCRPKHPAFPHAGTLFDAAERAGRVAELGRALRGVAVAPLPDLGVPKAMFLNLHPIEVNDDLIAEATTTLAAWSDRIVFEITESAQINDYGRLRSLIKTLQDRGFRVAVDDLGAGYAGLNSLALLKPDFVKLDMALVRGIDDDSSVARLIRHILDFTNEEGMKVVAEGVETARERRVVVDLGVDLLQGYYFARPGPPFVEVEAVKAWLSEKR
jgi:diguanylate cyclase (GGDEF)-like protein